MKVRGEQLQRHRLPDIAVFVIRDAHFKLSGRALLHQFWPARPFECFSV
jgi:hypothetical protein